MLRPSSAPASRRRRSATPPATSPSGRSRPRSRARPGPRSLVCHLRAEPGAGLRAPTDGPCPGSGRSAQLSQRSSACSDRTPQSGGDEPAVLTVLDQHNRHRAQRNVRLCRIQALIVDREGRREMDGFAAAQRTALGESPADLASGGVDADLGQLLVDLIDSADGSSQLGGVEPAVAMRRCSSSSTRLGIDELTREARGRTAPQLLGEIGAGPATTRHGAGKPPPARGARAPVGSSATARAICRRFRGGARPPRICAQASTTRPL